MKIKTLVPWYGSNRTNAHRPGEKLKDCTWIGVSHAGGLPEVPHFKAPTIVVNDKHRHIINLAKEVATKDRISRFIAAVKARPVHPDVLRDAQNYCKGIEAGAEPSSTLEWAIEYYLSAWMGRNGCAGTSSEFQASYSVRWRDGGGDSAVRVNSAIESLDEWHSVLRPCTFVCMDCFDFLDRCYDLPKHGIYADTPFPYVGDSYKHKMELAMLKAWAGRLNAFEKAPIVVRYYDHELIREWYPESTWNWERFEGRRQSNTPGAEVLISRRC